MALTNNPKVFFFYDLNESFSLLNRTELKKFVEYIFKKERKNVRSLNYVFCSDKRLLQINRDFLHHDYYTDIITFDLSDSPHEIAGEIYISIDRVRDNARQARQTFKSELHRVIFHGALHLCGYKDKSTSESALMRAKEDEYLFRYFKQ